MLEKSRSLVLLLLVFSGQVALGQLTTATLSGVVRDETGAVLPGVNVVIRNVDTSVTRTLTTDDEGRYYAPDLPLGNYEVKGELAGFQTAVRSGITLTVGQQAVVHLTLKVGEITEKVVVTGEAPLVETTSSSMSGLVDERKIRDLPLNSRSFVDLALLQSGVSHVRAFQRTDVGSAMGLSISGGRPNTNNFMVDGSNVSVYNNRTPVGVGGSMPGVEAIKEFSVLTHNFSAEYGRGSGGVINAVTKSGTNEFHGSLFEFHRNDNLDARNFFDESTPEFKRNQFGFTLGGPILRDKTFFFGSYEGLRESLGLTTISTVPDEQARRGVLPDGAVEVKGGVRPYLNLFPAPNGRNFGDGRAEFVAPFSQPTNKNYFIVRVDHHFSESDSFFARYTSDRGTIQTPGGIPQLFAESFITPFQYATVEERKIFSPSLLNTFRFGYTRTVIGEDNLVKVQLDPSLSLVPGQLMPQLSVTNLATLGPSDSFPSLRTQNTFEYVDNLSYIRGRHSVRAGFQVQRIQINAISETRQRGRWNFPSLRDFLLGNSSRVQIAPPGFANSHRAFRQTLFGLFVQDDFRLLSNLTFNLGLRYEFTTVLRERYGKQPRLLDSQVFTATPDDIVTTPPWYENPDLKNFAPRLGMAFDPWGDGRTAVRAGFGIFHSHIDWGWITPGVSRMAPFYNIFDLRGVPFPSQASEIVARLGRTTGNQAFQFGNNPASQYLMHFSLDLQREIVPDLVLSIGYSGSRGVHLGRIVDYNMAFPEAILPDGRPIFSARPVRPNRNFELMNYIVTDNDSFYHGLLLKANKRFSRGLQFQVSYTLSKMIDEAAGTSTGGADAPSGSGGGSSLSRDFKHFNRSLSGYDLRHNFVLNYTYELPVGPGRHFGKDFRGLAAAVLGGWQLNGIVSTATGFPVTIQQGTDSFTAIIGGSRRPDLVPDRKREDLVLGGADQYYDPTAFRFADPRFFGNAGRNILSGPGVATLDFALAKSTNLRNLSEDFTLQFRAEFFNLLNRANFGIPANTVFDGRGNRARAAGRISDTTTTSRQVQLGLKILF